MNTLLEEVRFILDKDELISTLAPNPRVSLIPFMGRRDSFYVLVALILTSPDESRAKAIMICERAMNLILNSVSTKELPGVEIVPCDIFNGQKRRIFRLSVKNEAFARAKIGGTIELLNDIPFPGATCGWYVPKPY